MFGGSLQSPVSGHGSVEFGMEWLISGGESGDFLSFDFCICFLRGYGNLASQEL